MTTATLRPIDGSTFSISLLDLGENFFEHRKVDVKNLYDRCEITADQISRSDSYISGWQLREMLRSCRDIAIPGQPLSVLLSEFAPITVPGGMFGLASFTAKTVDQALKLMVDYSHTVMPAYHFERIDSGGKCHIVMRPVIDFGDVQHYLDEVVAGYFLNLRYFCNLPLPAPRIHLTHCVENDISRYEYHFKATFAFSKRIIEVIFDNHHLIQHLHTHNQSTFEQVYASLKTATPPSTTSLASKVKNLLRQRLTKGLSIHIALIAEQMHYSERTLARHLQSENTSFLELKKQVSIEHAKFLLASTDDPICKISHACGYNSDSNFSRAFKNFTGKTPKRFRQDQ